MIKLIQINNVSIFNLRWDNNKLVTALNRLDVHKTKGFKPISI